MIVRDKKGVRPARAHRVRGSSNRKTRIPPLKKGLLAGYHFGLSTPLRHLAIARALRKEGSLGVGRHLLALSTLTRATIPKASKIYKMNSAWVFALRI